MTISPPDVQKGLDIVSLTDLDWDYEPGCDYKQGQPEQCVKPAEWKVQTSCCGKFYFFCDYHFWDLIHHVNDKNIQVVHEGPHGCGAQDITMVNAERIKNVGS